MKERSKFVTNSSYRLVISAAIAAGLAPFIFLYKNYTLIASWNQFFTLAIIYILIPIIVFFSFSLLSRKVSFLNLYKTQLLTLLNTSAFTTLFIYSAFGLKKKLMLLCIVGAIVLSFLIYKYLKKLIKFQLLLAFVGVLFLVPKAFTYFSYDDKWQAQPDLIEAIKFEKTPNIYLIQPDGYIGFSEVGKGNYQTNNDNLKSFLLENNFNLYPNFRSNYYSTLSSNSSMFSMTHHYYNRYANVSSELLFARDIIISENPVLSILKNNNYSASLILENSYLVANRPKMGYDFSNIDYDELPPVVRGFEFKKDVLEDFKLSMSKTKEGPQFYFIERIMPGHIATFKSYSEGKEGERLKYLSRLDETNIWLKDMVDLINAQDPEALIVIVADHGGFVGYEYSANSHVKPESRDNTFSMFSSLLAVKWPKDVDPYDFEIKSSVNLFRTIFASLSEDKSYLKYVQENGSYLTINEGASPGIYRVIDEDNKSVFKILEPEEN